MTKTTRCILAVTSTLLCLLPVLASAKTERYILNYGDTTFSSHNRQPVTLFLKRELSRQYPGLDLSKSRLEKVVVMAKSKKGRGSARLRVNDRYSREVRINGSPKSFHDSAKFNYDKITLYNPAGSSSGPWQLKLAGKLKVRKLVLVVDKDKKRRPRYNQTPAHSAFQPVLLPARTWGTRLEGERGCGHRSANARDGWDSPDSICGSGAWAVFRAGYRPTRLYIKPDIRPIERLGHTKIRQLGVTLTLSDLHRSPKSGNSVTLGIDIGGRTFTRKIVLKGSPNQKLPATETLTISGKWDTFTVANARVWILPENTSGDLAVKQLHIRVKKVG